MPTYSSQCPVCSKSHDYIRRVDDRNDVPVCCGVKTERQLTAPMVSAMVFTDHKSFRMPDGKDGGKGTLISSGQDYKKYLKDTNSIPGAEGKAESARIISNRQSDIKKKRREDVIDVVNKMM